METQAVFSPGPTRASKAATGGPEVGAQAQAVSSVQAQAEAIWQQTKFGSETTLDAIHRAIGRLAQAPGKRILLMASGGFLTGDLEGYEDSIISDALHAGVVINSLDAKGLYAASPGRPLGEPAQTTNGLPLRTMVYEAQTLGDRLDSEDAGMARLSESTGGLLFRNNNDLDLGFRELGMAPDTTYVLAIKAAEDGRYHTLKVKLDDVPEYSFLQARPGYFAPRKAPDQNLDLLVDEVFKDDAIRQIPMKCDLSVGQAGGENSRRIEIVIRIDTARIHFARQDQRRLQNFTFIAVLSDKNGNFIAGEQAQMLLRLRPETYTHLLSTGTNGAMTVIANPGIYRLRVVIQDQAGLLSTQTNEIRVE